MRTLRANATKPFHAGDTFVLELEHLEQLLQRLASRGYDVVGPTLREGAIVYDHLTSTEDLPSGWTDEQTGGSYRLKPRKDHALFGNRSARTPGKSSCSRPLSSCGRRRATERDCKSCRKKSEPGPSMLSSACAPANCTRLRSRTRSSSRVSSSIQATRRGARTCFCWQSIAARLAATVSALQ